MKDHDAGHMRDFKRKHDELIEPMLERARGLLGKVETGETESKCKAKFEDIIKWTQTVSAYNTAKAQLSRERDSLEFGIITKRNGTWVLVWGPTNIPPGN